MLRGGEHFYDAWWEMVACAVQQAPIVDLGTPAPFHKEMAAFEHEAARPIWCVDYVPSDLVTAVADCHSLPFRDEAVGSVLLSHVLEHVAEPVVVMREVQRVLRPGGKAYVTLLDRWPYHARPGVYPDYHRFKQDAVNLLFRGWSDVQVMNGGGIAQTCLLRIPAKWSKRLQPLANLIDRRRNSSTIPVRYVVATR